MPYPIRKPLLIASLALACVAFTANTLASANSHKSLTASAAVIQPAEAPVPGPAPSPVPAPATTIANSSAELYGELNLEQEGMKSNVFDLALKGLEKLSDEGKITNTDKITIADFSQPSDQKRLYVIDLRKKQVLFHSLVAHGRETGDLWATSFSNNPSSYKSAPGFYVTEETYRGHNGYSLRLDGLEKNINDNARNRAIVVHGAPYVSESAIHSLGFLGRSEGCPALPTSLARPIINTIKDGTCLFIYTADGSYLNNSQLLD